MKKSTKIKLLISVWSLFLTGLLTTCHKSPLTCDFSGKTVQKTQILTDFDTVEVNPLIHLTLVQDTLNKIVIETDEDVLEQIDYHIEDNKLSLTNHTRCLIQNQKAEAHITLYVNDITTLIANTDLDIRSADTLHFNRLKIICENARTGTNNIADFNLKVQIPTIEIIANGSSIFDISGSCNNLFVGFYGVNPVFRGKKLTAQHIKIFQRSDADMHLYPVQSIKGNLYGYGDIYLYHRPPVVAINSHYAGHIYFVN